MGQSSPTSNYFTPHQAPSPRVKESGLSAIWNQTPQMKPSRRACEYKCETKLQDRVVNCSGLPKLGVPESKISRG